MHVVSFRIAYYCMLYTGSQKYMQRFSSGFQDESLQFYLFHVSLEFLADLVSTVNDLVSTVNDLFSTVIDLVSTVNDFGFN